MVAIEGGSVKKKRRLGTAGCWLRAFGHHIRQQFRIPTPDPRVTYIDNGSFILPSLLRRSSNPRGETTHGLPACLIVSTVSVAFPITCTLLSLHNSQRCAPFLRLAPFGKSLPLCTHSLLILPKVLPYCVHYLTNKAGLFNLTPVITIMVGSVKCSVLSSFTDFSQGNNLSILNKSTVYSEDVKIVA